MLCRSMRKGLSEKVIFRLGTSMITRVEPQDNTELALRGRVLGTKQECVRCLGLLQGRQVEEAGKEVRFSSYITATPAPPAADTGSTDNP